MNKENIKKQLEALYETEPSGSVWDQIELGLNKKDEKKFKLSALWPYSVAAAVVTIMAVGFLMNQGNENKKIAPAPAGEIQVHGVEEIQSTDVKGRYNVTKEGDMDLDQNIDHTVAQTVEKQVRSLQLKQNMSVTPVKVLDRNDLNRTQPVAQLPLPVNQYLVENPSPVIERKAIEVEALPMKESSKSLLVDVRANHMLDLNLPPNTDKELVRDRIERQNEGFNIEGLSTTETALAYFKDGIEDLAGEIGLNKNRRIRQLEIEF